MEISEFKEMYFGMPAVVVCTGPSLNATPTQGMPDRWITISMNNIWLLERGDNGFVPDFWIAEDTHVIFNNLQEIIRSNATYKLLPLGWENAVNSSPKPHGAPQDWLERFSYFTIPYNDESYRFSEDCARFIGWGSSVTFCAIQWAAYIGCNPIYIIGMDHKYDEKESASGVPACDLISAVMTNHFSPDYYQGQAVQHRPRLDRMDKAFAVADAACKARGIEIINLSPGTKCDAFTKANWNDAVGVV